jgi:hypothetical protein
MEVEIEYLDDGSECTKCGAKDNLLDHHVSYVPEIIETLCRSCHMSFHKRYPDRIRVPKDFKRKAGRKWTTIALKKGLKDELIDYALKQNLGKCNWEDIITHILKELNDYTLLKQRYRLK